MNEKSKRRILITGGCGKIGSYFVQFASDKYSIRVVDKVAWDSERLGPFSGESLVLDLQSFAACLQACANMDMVIHLAADPDPKADFEDSLLGNNIIATYNMFRAAQEAGCQRFLFASSVHAVAAYPTDVQIKVNMSVRPTNLYGVSKCFGEALAAYFAFNEGLPSIALRIGAYRLPKDFERLPSAEKDAFLSADDLNDLLIRCLETPDITFVIVHAISDNKFKRLDLTETKEIFDYRPQADAFELVDSPSLSATGREGCRRRGG
jgi:nucleoside-diphosphate-sugar epimerase